MPGLPRRSPLLALATVLVVLLGLLAGCGGSNAKTTTSGKSPTKVLDSARQQVADAKGLTISLSTDAVPKGSNGILDATGLGTSAPAFEGTIKAVLNGLSAEVPIVSVDGKVYAQLFGTAWRTIIPADYGAPDPAKLFGPDGGLVAMLTDVKDLKKGSDQRDGKAVYSTLTGTIDGSRIKATFPSADTSDFAATFTLDDQDRIVKAVVKGPFYVGKDDITYTIALSKYGVAKDIKKP